MYSHIIVYIHKCGTFRDTVLSKDEQNLCVFADFFLGKADKYLVKIVLVSSTKKKAIKKYGIHKDTPLGAFIDDVQYLFIFS